jgi:hypothetical protein
MPADGQTDWDESAHGTEKIPGEPPLVIRIGRLDGLLQVAAQLQNLAAASTLCSLSGEKA